MKTALIALAILALTVSPVAAATRTERECQTDSYGNTTCRDKITDIETGVITYTNEVTTYASGATTETTSTSQVEILNTSTPSYINLVAGAIVALGGASWVVKRTLKNKN